MHKIDKPFFPAKFLCHAMKIAGCRIFLLTFFVGISGLSVVAQIYPHKNLTVKDGLINSSVYAIAQDSSGFIWFGTENGLSRFDGTEFRNYSLENLGISSFISSLHCVNRDEIILGCGINGIYRFSTLTGKARRINTGIVSQCNDIIIRDSLLISLHEYHNIETVSLLTGSNKDPDIMISTDPENKANTIIKLADGRILLGRMRGLYEIINNRQVKMEIGLPENHPVYSLAESGSGDVYIGTSGAIYRLSGRQVNVVEEVSHSPEKRVKSIVEDRCGKIWYNLMGSHDVFMTIGSNLVNVSKIAGLKNTTVTRIFADRDGNIWLGTAGKGVYLFSNLYITNYPESVVFPNANVRKIKATSGDGLIIGTTDGMAYLNSRTGEIKSFRHVPNMIHFVRDIRPVNDSFLVVATTDPRLNEIRQKDYVIPGEKIRVRYFHGSSLLPDSSVLLVGNWDNCLLEYMLPSFQYLKTRCGLFPDEVNKMRVNTMFRDRNGLLWVGGQRGFFVTDHFGNKKYPETIVQAENINSITAIDENRIVVISNIGYVVYESAHDLAGVKAVKFVPVPNLTSMAFTGNDEYVAGTLNGFIYHFKGREKLISVSDGILSDNINDVYHAPGSRVVWVGSAEGLMHVNLDSLKESLHKQARINYITVQHNDSTYHTGKDKLQFAYSKSSFNIRFIAFNYQNPRNVKYQYQVNDGGWNFSPAGDLQFTSLEPGDHIIRMRASADDKNWGPVSFIRISIIPPFYMTWWFYSTMIFVCLALLYFLFRYQMKKIKAKQDEKMHIRQKMVELQQKALASNLNPHFVFNSLNSIQHFINSNNQEDANNYLAKFSRLMRMHLNMADMSFVSLSEEVRRLEFYLNLEQMRFGERMNWVIEVDERIDQYKLQIPNMIVQPFVENAIWHGIMPMKEKGEVKVRIYLLENGNLEITIGDNGVGIGSVHKSSNTSHTSKGVKLIRERLALLDETFTDFLKFSNNHPGTLVTLILTRKMYQFQRELNTITQ